MDHVRFNFSINFYCVFSYLECILNALTSSITFIRSFRKFRKAKRLGVSAFIPYTKLGTARWHCGLALTNIGIKFLAPIVHYTGTLDLPSMVLSLSTQSPKCPHACYRCIKPACLHIGTKCNETAKYAST